MHVWKVWNEANRDVKLLWYAVFLRMMAYGMTNQILTLFLSEIGISDEEIGWFMSMTLAGDVVISYVLTWYADTWGRKKVLVYGSIMMTLSGIVFAFSENFYVLLLFAVVGVISPSSEEVGPFKSIEESMMAHLTPHNERPEIYSMHSMVGTIGSALGSLACGVTIDILLKSGIVSSEVFCYKIIFVIYAVLATFKIILSFSLSAVAEEDGDFEGADSNCEVIEEAEVIAEDTALIVKSTRNDKLSKQTISVLLKLLLIFMTDSFGSGFMTTTWMVYYYNQVFNMSNAALGILFFSSKFVMAASAIPSSLVARAFGPVKGTLLVQIPSGIFSILVPFAEPHFMLSLSFLLIYFFTTAMDVTPRQIILTNIIKPKDLTKVMGLVNIGKTFARCIGPVFAGQLASRGYLWFCFVISGTLVILADFFLAVLFYDVDKQILAKTNN